MEVIPPEREKGPPDDRASTGLVDGIPGRPLGGPPGEWADRVKADLLAGRYPTAIDELVDSDPATVRAIRRAILGKANRLVRIVMDALEPPEIVGEDGKVVPQLTMNPEKRAGIALKLLALGLTGTDQQDAGLMGKGSRTLRTATATPEELEEYRRAGSKHRAAEAAKGGQDG